jgi:glycosyltransferase involved in cell wall biosynthesis
MPARDSFSQVPLLTQEANSKSWLPGFLCLFERKGAANALPGISVVIPAHNEERYLDATLEALNRQSHRAKEVIVVANGCTDGTVQVAQRGCDRCLILPEKNLGKARNLGARAAEGPLLLFLDADTLLEPEALRRIGEQFSALDAAGTLRARPDSNRLACHLIYVLKNFLHRWALHPGSSGVILCWQHHFVRVGGFDEGLEVRENSDLIRRLTRHGRYRFVGQATVTTSMRRYEQCGVGKILWLWCKLWVQSIFGDLHHRRYEAVR